MIICHRKHLEQRCLERGRDLAAAMACVVDRDGDMWTVDVDHAAYPGPDLGALSFKCVPDCTTPQFPCNPGLCCEENLFDGTNSCLPCGSSSSSDSNSSSSSSSNSNSSSSSLISSSSSSSYKSCWDQRYSGGNYGCDAGTHCCNGVCVEDVIDGVYNQCKCWECDGYYSSNCFDFDHLWEEGFCYDIGRAMTKEECEAGNPAEGIDPCSCSGPNCV
jgi:hypothetical protein